MLKLKLFKEVQTLPELVLPPTWEHIQEAQDGLTGRTILPIRQSLFTSGTERGFFNKALYITPLPN